MCPAWGQTCGSCKRRNHFSSVCRAGFKVAGVKLVAHVQYDNDRDCFRSANNIEIEEIPATVSSADSQSRNGTVISIFPDSGASICIGNSKHLELLGMDGSLLRPCHRRIVAVGGSSLPCHGWIPLRFNVSGHSTTQPVYICDKVD